MESFIDTLISKGFQPKLNDKSEIQFDGFSVSIKFNEMANITVTANLDCGGSFECPEQLVRVSMEPMNRKDVDSLEDWSTFITPPAHMHTKAPTLDQVRFMKLVGEAVTTTYGLVEVLICKYSTKIVALRKKSLQLINEEHDREEAKRLKDKAIASEKLNEDFRLMTDAEVKSFIIKKELIAKKQTPTPVMISLKLEHGIIIVTCSYVNGRIKWSEKRSHIIGLMSQAYIPR